MQNIFYVAIKDKEGTGATDKASKDIEEICRRGGIKHYCCYNYRKPATYYTKIYGDSGITFI